MSAIKTYFLVPNNDFPADGPIVLGSILAGPSEPDEILNDGDVVEVPPACKHTSYKDNWEETIEIVNDGKIGVWTRFLNTWLGGNLGASFDARTVRQYKIEELETTYFSPSQEYIEEAVRKAGVQSYLEGGRYALPVYMVTGLKLARGPNSQVTSRRLAIREGHTNLGLAGFMTVAPIALDAGDMSFRQTRNENSSFEGSSDFVIGYRLRKITVRKDTQQMSVTKHQKHTEGAMLGVETRRKVDDSASQALRVIIEQDAVARELPEDDLVAAIDEEGNEDCKCFIVPAVR
jgi:hypothetical protein